MTMENYTSMFYKADTRVSEISGNSRHLSTLQHAFGDLRYINDVFLMPGHEISYSANAYCRHILLPLVGGVSCNSTGRNESFLASEEVMFLSDTDHTIRNPFPDQQINYLHIGLKKTSESSPENIIHTFSLDTFNQMSSLGFDESDENSFACTGIYKGRTKSGYTLKHPGNGLFAYVINGAFEIEERLMEHRDGLALWNIKSISFESLSEFGILLLLEIPLHQQLQDRRGQFIN